MNTLPCTALTLSGNYLACEVKSWQPSWGGLEKVSVLRYADRWYPAVIIELDSHLFDGAPDCACW